MKTECVATILDAKRWGGTKEREELQEAVELSGGQWLGIGPHPQLGPENLQARFVIEAADEFAAARRGVDVLRMVLPPDAEASVTPVRPLLLA